MSFFGARPSGPAASTETPDVEVSQVPEDSISRVAFCPTANILAVASWGNEVRLFDVSPARESRPRSMYKHEGPVLDLCWSHDGSKLFSASSDKSVLCFDLNTQQTIQVAAHADAVSAVRWINSPTGAYLATASWDKTLKYWNLGNSNPIASVDLPERCYSMDAIYPLLVVATAERHVCVINLANPTSFVKNIVSPLKWQTRTVACLPDAKGWAMGGIEGRLAIQYVDEKDANNNFSFKCHRQEQTPSKGNVIVHALNNICMHPEYGTFVTCGSDGTVSSWDHTAKVRLKSFEGLGGPVVSASYNYNQTILAMAVAYDWHKGHVGMISGHPNKVLLHVCKDEETKKRARK